MSAPRSWPTEAASIAAANRTAASALISGLVAGGVRHVVASPGSRSTPLVLACHEAEQRGELTLHTVLDERSAGFYALGLARGSGAPAALVATSGSAGAHYHPAVIEASESGVPLVILTADRPPELQYSGAPQTIDQRRLFGTFVRAALDLPVPDVALGARPYLAFAARALLAARGSNPGPVQLDVPFREPLWSAELPELAPAPGVTLHLACAQLDPASVRALADQLGAERRGVIVSCAAETPATAAVELAARLGWPVLAEGGSGLRFGAHDRGPVITRYDAILRSAVLEQELAPRLVLLTGRAPCSKTLARWLERRAAGRVIAIGPSHADPSHLASAVVSADPAAVLAQLAAAVPAGGRSGDWLELWRGAEQRATEVLDRPLPFSWEGGVASQVAAHAPDGCAIHAGNGMPVRDLDAFVSGGARDVRVFVSRGANGIDGTVSTAIGEAIGSGRKLILVLGDLAALHDLSGLRLLAELSAPVVVVVVDNGGGGIFSFLPIAEHPTAFERHFLTPQAASFPQLARALGIRSFAVATPEALDGALSEALGAAGPALIHVPIDRDANVAEHKRRWAEVARSLDQWAAAPLEDTRRPQWTSAG